MKRKQFISAVALLSFTIMLASCGGETTSTPAPSQTASPGNVSTPTATAPTATANTSTANNSVTPTQKVIKAVSEYEPTDDEPSSDETWNNEWNEEQVEEEEPSDVYVSNFVKNASFENEGDNRQPIDWETDNDTISYVESGGGQITGDLHMTHWTNSGDYDVSTWQTIELPNGKYDFSAYIIVKGDVVSSDIVFKNAAGDVIETVSAMDNLEVLEKITINGVTVTDGKLTVLFHTVGASGSAIFVDDVRVAPVNHVVNGNFEADGGNREHTGWETDSEYSYTEGNNDAYEGDFHMTHWSENAFEASSWQVITLPNGIYDVTAYIQVGKDNELPDVAEMIISGYDGDKSVTQSLVAPEDIEGYNKYVANVEVKDGTLKILFHTKGEGWAYTFMDGVSVTVPVPNYYE